MLTLTLTSDPLTKTVSVGISIAFLLNIFSTAVKPCPLANITFGCAKILFLVQCLEHWMQKLCNFFSKKTIEYELPALINSIFCGLKEEVMSISSFPS